MVKWVRSWRLWQHYADFFPIKVIKTAELPADGTYLLGSHPHGILCSGAVSAFAHAVGWDALFPGLEVRLLTLIIQFCVPLHRELGYW